MADAIAAMRDAFAAISTGDVWQPRRVVSPDGGTLAMLSSAGGGGGTVIKVVSIRGRNRELGLPTINSAVLWLDRETGQAEALIDGTALTALRTGAASGLASKVLAAPNARTLAMIGTGGQALDQVRAVCTVRDIASVRVAARSYESACRLGKLLTLDSAEIIPTASIAEAVDGADIICCATTSEHPLFSISDVARRVHINAIGSYRPTMCELGPELLHAATMVAVDQRAAALEEAGDLIQALAVDAIQESDLVEIGSLLSPEPENPSDGITVFKSVGISIQDWAVARLAVDRASQDSAVEHLFL